MRIIAGIAKGMPLAAPRGSGTRPTSDRVREAIFSSLGARVVGADVLDLFAGTGALGLEAASRGAQSAMFIETAPEALRRNIETFRKGRDVSCELSVVRGEVFVQLRKLAAAGPTFSIVFADPPYGETAQTLLSDETLPKILADGGTLVLESSKREVLRIGSGWIVAREAVYGDTKVNFLAME